MTHYFLHPSRVCDATRDTRKDRLMGKCAFPELQAQQSHFSTYLDKDKDGALNMDEMRDWVLPSHDREEGEAWRLISVGDINQDTKLTREELAAAPDYFMGILPHEFWQQQGHAGGVKHDEF